MQHHLPLHFHFQPPFFVSLSIHVDRPDTTNSNHFHPPHHHCENRRQPPHTANNQNKQHLKTLHHTSRPNHNTNIMKQLTFVSLQPPFQQDSVTTANLFSNGSTPSSVLSSQLSSTLPPFSLIISCSSSDNMVTFRFEISVVVFAYLLFGYVCISLSIVLCLYFMLVVLDFDVYDVVIM